MRLGMLRYQLRGLAEQGQRFPVIAKLLVEHAKKMIDLGIVRQLLQQCFINVLRLVKPALLMQLQRGSHLLLVIHYMESSGQ